MTSPLSPALPTSARPDTWLPAALAMKPRWTFCREVRGGTEVMRRDRLKYLPRFEAEHDLDWDTRVAMTVAEDALGMTIDTLVGLAFTVEPELGTDVPARIQEDWENIDGEGTHGTVFAQQALDSALQDGHCGILTDFPPVAPGITMQEERAEGNRAYLLRITIDQIVSWRVVVVGGRRLLGQLVLMFETEREDGAFGVRKVTEYRVYRLTFPAAGPVVELEVWEHTGNQLTITQPSTPIRGPTLIPFSTVFGGQRTGFLESLPPLHGLAYLNVAHTQLSSDQAMLLHKCAVPIHVAIGVDPGGDLRVGNNVWQLPVGGDAKVIEPGGGSLQSRRDAMQDLERRMADHGVAMLQREGGTEQTATESANREKRRESKLARAVRSTQDAFEASLGFMAAFYGLPSGGSILMRRDFSALTLSDADIVLINAMRQNNDLTLETYLKLVRSRGGVFEQIEPEEEAEAVRREGGAEDIGLDETTEGGGDPSVVGQIRPQPAGTEGEDATPPADVILNGAQITAAKDIVIAVAKGDLPRDTGVSMLQTFFRLSRPQAEAIMGTAGTGQPTDPNPNPAEEERQVAEQSIEETA